MWAVSGFFKFAFLLQLDSEKLACEGLSHRNFTCDLHQSYSFHLKLDFNLSHVAKVLNATWNCDLIHYCNCGDPEYLTIDLVIMQIFDQLQADLRFKWELKVV
jgi:hypothetical protein